MDKSMMNDTMHEYGTQMHNRIYVQIYRAMEWSLVLKVVLQSYYKALSYSDCIKATSSIQN